MSLPLWALVACSRVNFTFTFTDIAICGNVTSVLNEALLYNKLWQHHKIVGSSATLWVILN